MSECTRDTSWLLEATPPELRGETGAEDSDHLQECDVCAEAAQRVLAHTAALSEVLDRAPQPIDVDAIVARARFSAEPGGAARERGSQRRWRRRWVTLAAAASIVGLLSLHEQEGTLPGVRFTPRVTSLPTVETAVGHDVAVIETDNPDITVLWFF